MANNENSLDDVVKRILVCDDEKDVLDTMKDILSIKPKYSALYTQDPNKALYEATVNTSKLIAFLDISFSGGDLDRTGLRIAKQIRESRGDGIYLVIMTGAPVKGSEGFEASEYVNSWLTKPVEIKEIPELVEKAFDMYRAPKYPHKYIVVGPSGAGKSSTAGFLHKRMNWISSFISATERPKRKSDVPGDILFPRMEHEFLSKTELNARINETGDNAFVYAFDNYRYMLDLRKIDRAIRDGEDVLIITKPAYACEKLLERYPDAHVIYLRVAPEIALSRMEEEGRLESEIQVMEADSRYMNLAHTIVETQKGEYISTPAPNKQDAKKYVLTKIGELINWASACQPNNIHSTGVNSYFAQSIEKALSRGGRTLQDGDTITFPENTIMEYCTFLKSDVNRQHLVGYLDDIRTLKVTSTNQSTNIKEIHLSPCTTQSLSPNSKEHKPAMVGLINQFLQERGLPCPRDIFSDTPDIVSNALLYSLTDTHSRWSEGYQSLKIIMD